MSARRTGAESCSSLQEAAKGSGRLLAIATPMKGVPVKLPKDLFSDLPSSSPIIDTRNYYPLRNGVIPEIKTGMVESEWTSRVLGRSVIKVFNNIVAHSLGHRGLQSAVRWATDQLFHGIRG